MGGGGRGAEWRSLVLSGRFPRDWETGWTMGRWEKILGFPLGTRGLDIPWTLTVVGGRPWDRPLQSPRDWGTDRLQALSVVGGCPWACPLQSPRDWGTGQTTGTECGGRTSLRLSTGQTIGLKCTTGNPRDRYTWSIYLQGIPSTVLWIPWYTRDSQQGIRKMAMLDMTEYTTVDRMSHPLVCSNDGGCQNKLRILRAASTHFPVLGSFLSLAYAAQVSHVCG